ncbi:MAG: permease [Bacillota bacterium]|nr:permease [Bacillota bacterium]
MQTILIAFIIMGCGYLLGSVSIRGLSLGTSGVLIVALVFGHMGTEIPAIIRNFGLALFIGSVGAIAGPVFFRNIRKKVYAYLVLGILIPVISSALAFAAAKLFQIPASLAIGMFTGALTSTPGLAAALEATGDTLASVGYGIAYPFGVVGVVLFVQLYPRIVRTDIRAEADALRVRLQGRTDDSRTDTRPLIVLEKTGLLNLFAILAAGLFLGSLAIPLPGGLSFSLGVAGGPLLTGLLVGHFGRVGRLSLAVPDKTVKVMRELGLCLFLMGAGTQAGAGFVAVLREFGWLLFVIGVFITLLPMVMAALLAHFLLRMDTLSSLGSICGGMTSTPALGALISATGTEDVAASYAAAYPFALICMVVLSQLMALLG